MGGFMNIFKATSLSTLAFILVTQASCQRSDLYEGPKVTRWSKAGQEPLPSQLIADPTFSKASATLLTHTHQIKYQTQKIGRAIVKDGNLYQVRDAATDSLKVVRVQNALTKAVDQALIAEQAEELYKNQDHFYQIVQQKFTLLQDMVLLDEIKIIYDPSQPPKNSLYYALTFVPAEKGVAMECEFWSSTQLKECYQVSAHLDAPAWLFTLNNLEKLQEVLITSITPHLSGTLKANGISVDSDAPRKVDPRQLPFKYDTGDPRFDQIQAYYWANKGLSFLNDTWNIELPVDVEIKTSLGYPQKTNAMFTYQNQIRVGAGDGVTYQGLAHDPSVMLHEIAHVWFNHFVFLPTAGEGGSMNEAFADYFAATILNSPHMGAKSYLKGPYRRGLDAHVSFKSLEGKLYQDSLVISSALWEIEQTLGPEKARQLFFESLIRLGPATQISEYVQVWSGLIQEMDEARGKKIWQLLVNRDWPLQALPFKETNHE